MMLHGRMFYVYFKSAVGQLLEIRLKEMKVQNEKRKLRIGVRGEDFG